MMSCFSFQFSRETAVDETSAHGKKRKNMSIDVILKLCFIENCSTCILASNISIKVEYYSSLSISFHNQPHQHSSQDNANLLNAICCNI